METISISSKKEISIDAVNDALAQHWRVEGAGRNRLVVQEAGSRVYVYLDLPSTLDDVSRESKHADDNRLLVDYSDIDLVKNVIQVIANDAELIVDNDFGTVLPGDQFVARIKSDKTWNWRN